MCWLFYRRYLPSSTSAGSVRSLHQAHTFESARWHLMSLHMMVSYYSRQWWGLSAFCKILLSSKKDGGYGLISHHLLQRQISGSGYYKESLEQKTGISGPVRNNLDRRWTSQSLGFIFSLESEGEHRHPSHSDNDVISYWTLTIFLNAGCDEKKWAWSYLCTYLQKFWCISFNPGTSRIACGVSEFTVLLYGNVLKTLWGLTFSTMFFSHLAAMSHPTCAFYWLHKRLLNDT